MSMLKPTPVPPEVFAERDRLRGTHRPESLGLPASILGKPMPMREFSDVPGPCMPYPNDRITKTIGLAACAHCQRTDCFKHYLSWEKSRGVTLNEDLHHLVANEATT